MVPPNAPKPATALHGEPASEIELLGGGLDGGDNTQPNCAQVPALSNSLTELAARIRGEHEATAAAMKRSVAHAIAAGELLIEAKSLLQHGQWSPWLCDHCAMPERTARLYMRLATNREKIGNVADLSMRGAIALITAPKRSEADKFTRLVSAWAEDSIELDAFDESQAEHRKRREAFDAIDVILTKLTEFGEPAVDVGALADQMIAAIDDCTDRLRGTVARDVRFDPAWDATQSILKAQQICQRNTSACGGVTMSAPFDLRTIARALGGEVTGRQVLAPGPGHSARDRSLAVRLSNDAPDGFLCFSHAGDDWRECRDYVRSKLGLPEWQPGDGREQQRTIPPAFIDKWDFGTVDAEAEDSRRSEEDLIRIGWAQALWNEAGDPRVPAVRAYFNARALNLPDDLAGMVLRFHPRTPWRNEDTGNTDRIPCLVAAFRSIDDDQITGIHRVRLDQPDRWPKTQRLMLGVVSRAAVKLGPVTDGKLTIGEGIETCLAASQLGIGPAWALGAVGGISFFPLITGVSKLTVLAEAGDASARAVQMCGRRWRRAGRRVFVSRSNIGSDHNDLLMQRRIS